MYTGFPPSSFEAGRSRLRGDQYAPPSQVLNSPYTRIPLPATDIPPPSSIPYASVALHPVLANGEGAMRFSISLGTECITTQPTHSSLPPHILTEPATHPGLSSLAITSKYLPWVIVVSPFSGGVITVGDVLATIYTELHKRVSEGELRSLHASRERRLITEASRRRPIPMPALPTPPCSPTRRAQTWLVTNEGVVRRLDFLFGATRFGGLRKRVGGGIGEWELDIGHF